MNADKRIEEYYISTDEKMIQIQRVEAMLRKTHWAQSRPKEVIVKSIENSLAFGIYFKDEQVGFARVITDYTTAFYISDVVINEEHRRIGLGKKLIKTIVEDEQLTNLLGILATRDAHGLYQQFGFISSGDLFMYRARKE
ncbi:MAG: GNAT family N-acetyltransferase [Syntrophomonadaceae bacterium]|nr:GNAT family N-acetyltransferase [Syntrophomonadaceae bacterium]